MHRIFISSDIEGTCGIAHWDETLINKPDYARFSRQMTQEVAAACEGAIAAGADDILIKDAHDEARNIQPEGLPDANVRLFRGWGSDIHSMLSGIDESFAGAFFTGYHSAANTDTSPLSHTMTTRLAGIKINGVQASEMLINAYSCAMYDVPVLLVTGDEGVCAQAAELLPGVHTVPVLKGRGNGTISIHPAEAVRRIRAEAEAAVRDAQAHPEKFALALPPKFDVEVEYIKHFAARRASFYPGVRQIAARSVRFSSDAWYDCLRFMMFCLS